MGYALTLRQMPEGLIASALSITVLVRLSAITGDNTAFRETLAEGLRLALLLILPAGVGLFVLAHPITALLFEHGNFTAFDTEVVSRALRWYLLGLPFATIDLLLVVAFYARHNTLTPALIGLFTTAVYIGLSKALLPALGLYSLMLADSIRFALHAALSIYFLFRSTGGRQEWHPYGVFHTLRQTSLAVAVMGVGVGAVSALLPVGEAISTKAAAVFIPIVVGLALYGGMLFFLGTDELRLLNRIWLSVRQR
jgi:putative peptidoglycan lipid II flippase